MELCRVAELVRDRCKTCNWLRVKTLRSRLPGLGGGDRRKPATVCRISRHGLVVAPERGPMWPRSNDRTGARGGAGPPSYIISILRSIAYEQRTDRIIDAPAVTVFAAPSLNRVGPTPSPDPTPATTRNDPASRTRADPFDEQRLARLSPGRRLGRFGDRSYRGALAVQPVARQLRSR